MELLVVVSIIALLIAILLPSLRKAREQAKLATCLANMTGIAKASLVYAADDPGENMIPVPRTDVLPDASGSIEWGGKSGMGQAQPKEQIGRSPFGTFGYRGPAHRPLNMSLFKGGFKDYNPPDGMGDPGANDKNWIADAKLELGIYRCPSDAGFNSGRFLYTAVTAPSSPRNETAYKNGGLSSFDHYGVSYTANCFWISGGLSGSRLSSQSVYLTPVSRVPAPAASVAYLEMPARFAHNWGTWENAGCTENYSDRMDDSYATIPGWHRSDFKFNVAFADGHAATVMMQGAYNDPIPELGLRNYPANQCGPSLDAYECLRCVTVRGPGWQLDTLPAAAVLTPYYAD